MKPTKPEPQTVKLSLEASHRVLPHEMLKVWPVLEEMLILHYPPFRAATQEELLEQTVVALTRYVKELATFGRETLENAWSDTLREHTTERWPTIGVIVRNSNQRSPFRPVSTPPETDIKGRARPNYDYQVEQGLMTQEQAERRQRMDEAQLG